MIPPEAHLQGLSQLLELARMALRAISNQVKSPATGRGDQIVYLLGYVGMLGRSVIINVWFARWPFVGKKMLRVHLAGESAIRLAQMSISSAKPWALLRQAQRGRAERLGVRSSPHGGCHEGKRISDLALAGWAPTLEKH